LRACASTGVGFQGLAFLRGGMLPPTHRSIALSRDAGSWGSVGAAIRGEPFGVTQAAARCLTFSAILLALRAAPCSNGKADGALQPLRQHLAQDIEAGESSGARIACEFQIQDIVIRS